MKIVIFGATGKTGQHVCRRALAERHLVTAFTRSVNKIDSTNPDLLAVQGDIKDAETVAAAVAGQEAAIVVLGSNGLGDKTTLTTGTRNVVDGMTQHNVQRIVVLSAAGVGESWRQTSWLVRIMFKTMLRNIYSDHVNQEALIKKSSLDWTIVRAAILKDGPASGDYTASNSGKVKNINRADLADFLIRQVSDQNYRKQAVSVTQ